jgi:hypothetical protein
VRVLFENVSGVDVLRFHVREQSLALPAVAVRSVSSRDVFVRSRREQATQQQRARPWEQRVTFAGAGLCRATSGCSLMLCRLDVFSAELRATPLSGWLTARRAGPLLTELLPPDLSRIVVEVCILSWCLESLMAGVVCAALQYLAVADAPLLVRETVS